MVLPLRSLIIGGFLAGLSWGQCNCQSVVGCQAYITNLPFSSYNPGINTFMVNTCNSLSLQNTSLAGVVQQKPQLACAVLPAMASYFPTAPSRFGPAIIPFMAALAALGCTLQDIFVSLDATTTMSEYPSQLTAGDYNVPSDCPGHPRYSKGHFPSPSSLNPTISPHCFMASYYDKAFAYAATAGITLRSGHAGVDNSQVQACTSVTPAFTPGNITEAMWEHCYMPQVKTLFQHYGSQITDYQPIIEPLAATGGVQQFSVSDVQAIIVNFATAITTISPSTTIAATATGYSYPTHGTPPNDHCYWLNWTGVTNPNAIDSACSANTQAPTYLSLSGGVRVDLFAGSCDESAHYYANELSQFRTNYFSPTVNPNNLPLGIGQLDPPVWCPITSPFVVGSAAEANAYAGRGYYLWDNGFRATWQDMIIRWLGTVPGMQTVSAFCDLPLFNFTTDPVNNNCGAGSWTPNAMTSYFTPNDTGLLWGQLLTTGPAATLQGYTQLKGYVQVKGH